MKKILLACLLLTSCATFDTSQFQGLSMKAIQIRLGKPTIKRTESPYQLWSYKDGECALLIYFDSTQKVQCADHICP